MTGVQPMLALDALLAAVPLAQAAQEAAETTQSLTQRLAAIGWVDWTAIALLAVFFILGLFKGLLWQASRILTLAVAWVVAGYYGPMGEGLLKGWFGQESTHEDLMLFLSYVVLFLAVVIVLSLITILIQKLMQKEAVLTVSDRIGGAVLGLGTGAIAVLVIIAGIYMFVPADTGVVQAAQRSHSMELSRKAIDMLGDAVPERMQRVFGVGDAPPPAKPDAQPGANPGAEPGAEPDVPATIPTPGSGETAKKKLQPLDPPVGKGK